MTRVLQTVFGGGENEDRNRSLIREAKECMDKALQGGGIGMFLDNVRKARNNLSEVLK